MHSLRTRSACKDDLPRGEKSGKEVRELRQQDEARIFVRGFHGETLMREGEMSTGVLRSVFIYLKNCVQHPPAPLIINNYNILRSYGVRSLFLRIACLGEAI